MYSVVLRKAWLALEALFVTKVIHFTPKMIEKEGATIVARPQ
jgi:hypothetical protein